MNEYQSHTLKNGLRIVHLPTAGNVSYCGFIINAGTRDENKTEYGMAHFVEHMLFKGTKKRQSYHIINRMESVGGDINAYTNKEETVIYSTFLEEHFGRAFELLTDLTFNSVFPEKEIGKEIEVILDEINSYEDSPSELIYDDFENIIFKESQLGHNILGEPESLNLFDSAKANLFTKELYHPENIVFFSVGSTNIKQIIKLAEKYLTEIEINPSTRRREEPSIINNSSQIIEKDTNQTHALIGGRCYDMHSKKRKTLHLLNNILGGPGMNSRLNVSLREKRGYVYNVESSMTSYSDTGLFTIYFGCDKRNTDKCVKLIFSELKKLKENKLTTVQLHAAQKQMIGQTAVAADNHENLALGLGKSFLHYNHFNSHEEITKKINSITAEDILDVANEIFADNNLNRLIYQ